MDLSCRHRVEEPMKETELRTRSHKDDIKNPPSSDITPVTLKFDNITYEVKKKTGSVFLFWKRQTISKIILNDVSGYVEPGDLVALMGASGAGKSTLLNVLSRLIVSHDGNVFVNGEPAEKSNVLKTSSCFIQQEDLFFGHITVSEHLDHQARFRIPLDKEGRQARIQDVMDRFSLNKSRNSRIGNIEQGASRGISGGEKKRLSVATELLINPSLIFADEPTSGLDAFMAESVVEVLKNIANSGHTVITTIHQPSSDVFNMFNKLLLLSEGRVVYFGPRLGAIPYFLRLGHPCPPYTNPADFLIELLAVDWENPDKKLAELDVWCQHWTENKAAFLIEWETELKDKFESSLGSPLTVDILGTHLKCIDEKPFQVPKDANGRVKTVPASRTIGTLLRRSIIATARNPNVVRARLIQTVVTSLLGGLVYFRLHILSMGFMPLFIFLDSIYFRLSNSAWYSKSGACFFIMVNQGFMATYTSLTAFMGEKRIVIRERDSGLYHLATYYASKILSDLMFQFYLPVLYTIICWYLMGLNDTFTRFLLGMVFTFLLSIGSASIGYIIGSFAPNFNQLGVAVALGPIIILPCLLVAGFVIQTESLPVFWIWLYHLSPFVYGFSGLMRSTFLNVTFDDLPPCPIGSAAAMCKRTGNEVLENFSISTRPERWAVDILGLLAWAVIGRLIGLILFVWTNRRLKK